ncbi:hypothetical protein Tco_1482031 [Tanacetum coccineum]
MIRILAGQIGRFAAMTVMMILLLLQQKQIQTRYTLHFDTANYLIISEVEEEKSSSTGSIRPCGLVKVADKSEIVRILAGQIRKFAAMADVSSFFRLIRILAGQIGYESLRLLIATVYGALQQLFGLLKFKSGLASVAKFAYLASLG